MHHYVCDAYVGLYVFREGTRRIIVQGDTHSGRIVPGEAEGWRASPKPAWWVPGGG